MRGADIAALLIRFGPVAFGWIEELAEIWSKEMTPTEVKTFCTSKRKSLEEFEAAERAKRIVQ